MLNSIKVIFLVEYLDYANVFLEIFATKLFKHTNINNYLIDLVDKK